MTHPLMFESVLPSEEQTQQMNRVRSAFTHLVTQIETHIPEGPDRTFIIRQLRDSAMWCNVAIIRNPDGSPRG